MFELKFSVHLSPPQRVLNVSLTFSTDFSNVELNSEDLGGGGRGGSHRSSYRNVCRPLSGA
jgi:hypothetical protein